MSDRVRYYQSLNVFQAVWLCFARKRFRQIYYFNLTPFTEVVLKVLGLDRVAQPADFKFYELTDKQGESILLSVYGRDLMEFSSVVEEIVFSKDKYIGKLGELFGNPAKMSLYYNKCVYDLATQPIIYLNAVKFLSEKEGLDNCKIEYVLPWSILSVPLQVYAGKRFSISIISRFSMRSLFSMAFQLLSNLALLAWFLLLSLKPINLFKKRRSGAPFVMSNLYSLKGFTFNKDKRCDFPWLLGDRHRAGTLMYFEREDMPADEQMAETLLRENIEPIAMTARATTTSKIRVHRPTGTYLRTCFKLMAINTWLLLLHSRRIGSLICYTWAVRFIKEYARYRDFFLDNNIRVNIDFIDVPPLRIARHLAIESVGGIGISYQVSNWPVNNFMLASGAHVMFLFGGYFLARQEAVRSLCERFVLNGYLDDYAFSHIRDNAKALRKELTQNGAKFVICYFDENSGDGRMSLIPNRRSGTIYRKLLEMTIADHSLGLICSPKRPNTLLKRIPEIKELIERAKGTGRCVFREGNYGTDHYPAESSQAADITITLLLGGTTALECFLSGSKVIFLDLEKLYSYEEYEWGKGKVLFDSLDRLVKAIDDVRNNSSSEIGDRKAIVNLAQKDPHQDGRAAERMAYYLECLLEKLNQGGDRQAALFFADAQYRKAWGDKNVVKGWQK